MIYRFYNQLQATKSSVTENHSKAPGMSPEGKMQVYVRLRPLNKKESEFGTKICLEFDINK